MSINKSLLEVSKELEPIFVDTQNETLGNKYVSYDKLIKIVKNILNKHDLIITFEIESSESSIKIQGIIIDTKTNEKLKSGFINYKIPEIQQNNFSELQTFGSAVTYLKRYILGILLPIATEKDNDGNNSGKKN
jgi:hypothetical protein